MRLAKARLLASLVTTESVFLFLKIKVTAHSSKRKSSQSGTFTREFRDLGSKFRHEIRLAKLLPSFTTVLAVIFFLFIFNALRPLVGYSSTILRYGFHNQQTHHV